MRRYTAITDRDGTNRLPIPMGNREEISDRGFRTAVEDTIGQDGGLDLHGDNRAPMTPGTANLRFVLRADCAEQFDAELASLLSRIEGSQSQGLRKIWRADSDGAHRRFTWCRPTAKPHIPIRTIDVRTAEVELSVVMPDPLFYEPLNAGFMTANGYSAGTLNAAVVGEPINPDLRVAQFNVTSRPFAFSIINDGDMESRRIIFRLDASGASGFLDPIISNADGQSFSSTRDAAGASSILSINCAPGLGRARYSNNNGVTWVDDTPNLIVPSTQGALMWLRPGVNDFTYDQASGTPNLLLQVHWYHAFRD